MTMGLFLEDAKNQSETQKMALNAFMTVVVLDILNNILLQWSWFSVIAICLYITFIILFSREMVKGNKK